MKKIIIDTETTGLLDNDELLQVSILSYDGDVLFNEYIKPTRKKKWTKAQTIHGISPEMVQDCKTFRHYKKQIQEIIDSADMIIGYNTYFDLSFLESKGIEIPNSTTIYDVMEVFAEIYGEWNDYFESYKWQKLTTCARYYDYKWEQDAHNALGDCKATLFCYKKMTEKEDTESVA